MKTRIALYSLLAIVLFAGLAIGGYHLGWWLKKDTVNRNSEIIEESRPAQVGLRDGIVASMRDLTFNADLPEAQYNQIVISICEDIDRLNNEYKSNDIAIFESEHC